MEGFYQLALGILYPLVLVGIGVFFILRLRMFFIRHPLKVCRVFFKKNSKDDGVSPFKALTVALAGTLGVGNIVGVALALKLGGPGAMFWMWLSAFLLMPVKYAEICLTVATRRKRHAKTGNDEFYGGPMYYMSESSYRHSSAAAVCFCVLCIASSLILGNMLQISAAAESLNEALGIPRLLWGGAAAIAAALIVFGGFSSIGGFCVKAIPIMATVFVALSMWIILNNAYLLPQIFSDILHEAFHPRAALGGILSAAFLETVRQGMAKGVLTHEAGCGTSPISHACANTKSPAEQGFWGVFEVFADTFILCTMTALVILIAAQTGDIFAYDGILLTIAAFEAFIGPAAGIVLSVSVCFFAFATVISWSYYGIESINFLTQKRPAGASLFIKIYLTIYCTCIFLGSIVGGAVIYEISDVLNLAMTALNTVFLCIYSGRIANITESYFIKDKFKARLSGSGARVRGPQEKKGSAKDRPRWSSR